MTPVRCIAVVVASWVSLVLLAAFGAWAEPDPTKAAEYHHAAWMFALSGGIGGAFGMVLALLVALINEVRTARLLGQLPPRSLHRPHVPVVSGAVRRETGEV